MTITIFGADGRTGVEVVNNALSRKHQVKAVVYSNLDIEHDNLRVFKGDVLNYQGVDKAIENSDAVISVIGHIKGSDPFMQTKGITNIVNSMKKNGLKRLISLTGTGVRVEGDRPSLFDKLGNFAIKLIDRERIVDGIKHFEVIKDSNLDWTLVRVLKLSMSQDQSLEYRLTEHGPAENLTSRKKVANIILDLAESDEYIRKAPVVSG